MSDHSSQNIICGCQRAFVDASVDSDSVYSPQFVSNGRGCKVLSVLEKELRGCDSLFFSVAFITSGGIAPLLGTFDELKKKGIKGKILTTDYLMFSEPKALDTLNGLENLELRVFKTKDNNVGFHTKGYLFHNDDNVRIIVGSSNLTQKAITENYEWNTRIISTPEGQYAKDIQNELESLWESSICYNEYKDEYSRLYHDSSQKRHALEYLSRSLDLTYAKVLIPNAMQQLFTNNIESFINNGEHRALLISATGTGKTYASAFAIRDILSNHSDFTHKILFLSHREQINKQAQASYLRIFGNKAHVDLLSGNQNNVEQARQASFLFSTMNMMAKDSIREQFAPDDYSIIVLDECHRSGAESYQRIINYFKPKLLLGMSASPERTDDFDVFGLFGHNIACEIRLQQALENGMLCPFHYFGITDLFIEGIGEEVDLFRRLVSDERVRYIIEKAEYFGYSGDRVKGLIFCSTKQEAKELSHKFNNTGRYRTAMLCGEDSQEEREGAIERLVKKEKYGDYLDYIFTVDIFNEGVDIPEINQIIMLRPTESPIIFVQQMGRGLRKSEGKEYVIILDFIGNYQNNYMIPIALSGDRSGNKDNIRRSMMEVNNVIQGASTIYFDEIARDKIYKSIDTAQLDLFRTLKKEYFNLKFKLGRTPRLKEYDEMGELDPLRIIDKCGSYHAFLSKCDKEYHLQFSQEQCDILKFISTRFASGMRPHELCLLYLLIDPPTKILKEHEAGKKISTIWKDLVKDHFQIDISDEEEQCVKHVLDGSFFRESIQLQLVNYTDEEFVLSPLFQESLKNKSFFDELTEVIDFGIYRYKRNYTKNYQGTSFNLYKKYTYKEIFWLLNWEKEEVSLNIGGYKYDRFSNTYPIFINYEKPEDVSDTTKYEDRFIDQSNLIAISKSNRTIDSTDVQYAIRADEKQIFMPLFVRKNKNDHTSKEFYFLGSIHHNGYLKEIVMPNTNANAVEIGYQLDKPVDSNLFEYITEKSL